MSELRTPAPDLVFFLEDNLDVLDSTASFFETHGVQVLRAVTVAEAWTLLEKWHGSIRNAYIDKTLQRDQSAGIEFLVKARDRFPSVDFALLTAWNLDVVERERVASQNITVFEKTQARPDDLLVRFYRGGVPQADQSIGETSDDDVNGRAALTADLLFRTRLNEIVLKQREEKFQGRIRRIAEDLVQRLKDDERFGEGPILIGAAEYTSEELIQEVCDGSELGLALIDAHFAELEDLAEKVYGARR